MKVLFALIGAAIGAAAGGGLGALAGLLAGLLLAVLLGKPKTTAAAGASLDSRVAALEKEVADLRAALRRLAPAEDVAPVETEAQSVAAPEPVAAAATPSPTPAPEPEPAPAFVQTPPIALPEPVLATPAPAPVPLRERLPPFVTRFLFGGNTIVKVGVLVLFLGLAFLLRYAADRVTVPIELRYAGVSLAGVFLLGLGWRLRGRVDAAGGAGYGIILQGAGIGVFYLTALAAMRLHPLLSQASAFGFMAVVALLGAVLAVAQNAPWLALVSVLEGFAAPVLVSTGAGNHIALFSYLAILDIAIFGMAWFRAWRALNLVGAVATFALGGAWARAHYEPALYASVQAFLLLFFALFTAIGVLFARRALALGDVPDTRRPLAERAAQALAQVGRVDSTLTFGVPLAAFGMQYLLVKDDAWGPAWAAFGFALFYLLLGGALLRGRNPRYALLGEAHAIVGVIFGTLTIPLALEGAWTGATWAVEAAGMYWLGARQHRVYARAFAFAVMAGAALRLATSLTLDLQPGTPLLAGSVLGMALLAASAVAMTLVFRRVSAQAPHAWEQAAGAALPWLASAALAAIAWTVLLPLWASVVTAGLALGCAAVPPRIAPRGLAPCAAALHAVALLGLGSTLHTVDGAPMLADGWPGLVAASLIGGALLASGWLGLRRRAAVEAPTAPWSLASSLGLLAGLAVVDLALLFVLRADRAAWIWPWVGVLALWLGLRMANPALAIGWAALQVVSAFATLAFGPALWSTASGFTLWGPLVLSLAGFVAGDLLQRAATRHAWIATSLVEWAVVGWSLGWWTQVLPPELHRELARHGSLASWPTMLVAWVLLSSGLMMVAARWRAWRVLGQATAITVPALAAIAWIGPFATGDAPSAHLGWLFWPLALVWHFMLLRAQERWAPHRAVRPLHVLGFWLFLLLAARECQWWMAGWGDPGTAWPTLGWMIVPAAVLTLVTRPVVLQRWPLASHRDAYLAVACMPLAVYLVAWLWLGNTQSGAAAPLAYVPLLNPLELGQLLVLLALALWLAALPDTMQRWVPRRWLHAGLAVTAFALYTGMVLRLCHHWAGVAWDGSALFHSTLTQAALSVAWSIVGVGLMLLGHRGVRRLPWGVGAVLLGIVVVKLFLIELADRGGLYRIVSFIVVGVLLLVVGYFAPVPPKQGERRGAEAAA